MFEPAGSYTKIDINLHKNHGKQHMVTGLNKKSPSWACDSKDMYTT